jgi:hypothetical protein
MRLIPTAFAVRERLSDPRVVPSFRYLFFSDMSPSMIPEVPVVAFIQLLHHRHWPSLGSETLGTLEAPTIRFRWGTRFRDFLVRFRYDLPDCSPPFGGSDRVLPQPQETFTSGLSTIRSPSSSPDITTAANWTTSAGGTLTHKNSS